MKKPRYNLGYFSTGLHVQFWHNWTPVERNWTPVERFLITRWTFSYTTIGRFHFIFSFARKWAKSYISKAIMLIFFSTTFTDWRFGLFSTCVVIESFMLRIAESFLWIMVSDNYLFIAIRTAGNFHKVQPFSYIVSDIASRQTS